MGRRWRSAYRRSLASGADVVPRAHHHEGASADGTLAVSTSAPTASGTRGGRPSVFNLLTVDSRAVHIRHYRWESTARRFLTSDVYSFARQGEQRVAVSVAGGDQGP